MDITLPVSLTTAAGLALINVWLTSRIGQLRGKTQIWVGDGGDETMIRRMRTQANLIENAPFVLALIVLIELARGTSTGLWAAGGAFLIARVLHVFGMDGLKGGRTTGAVVTLLLLVGLAGYAAYIGLQPAPELTPMVLSPQG